MSLTVFDIYNESRTVEELVSWLVSQPGLIESVDRAVSNAAVSGEKRLVCSSIPFERMDPLAALEVLGDDDKFQYFWENPEDNFALAAGNEVVKIRCNHRDRFQFIKNKIGEWNLKTDSFSTITHSLTGIHFLGGFSFLDQPQDHKWKQYGTSTFVIPEWILIRDGQLSILTITLQIEPGSDAPDVLRDLKLLTADILNRLRSLSANGLDSANGHSTGLATNGNHDELQAEISWKNIISKAKRRIHDGEFKKIVLARQVSFRLNRSPRTTQMLNFLRSSYPTCYTFMMRLNDSSAFLGCTPEKLAILRSSIMLTDGLAGTISRGKTATEDTILERKLLQSDKDLVEHNYVVEAIGERLRGITSNMQFPAHPGIRKYHNVQHLYTPITASLNDDITPIDIMEKLHPTPAVGGYPREATIQHIQELEQIDRGWYAGPVGWLNNNGRGEFCVAIRSGLIEKDTARFFAGCGILADSNPQSEWEETRLKLIPMFSALKNA